MQNNLAKPPNYMNLLQNLYTGVVWVDDALNICWVNTQTEQLFSVSQSRLIGINILTVLSSTEPLPGDEPEAQGTLPDTDNLGVEAQSKPSKTMPSKRQPLAEQQAQAHLYQSQLAVQFANAKHYQQPFIEYNRHIVGVIQPVFVNYSVTPVEQDSKTYFLVELWEKNRQSRIDKEYRLQEQHEVAREMLRSVAHEVKNPLAGIRGAAQLLIKQTQRAQNRTAAVAQHAQHLVSEPLIAALPLLDADNDDEMMLVDAKKVITYAGIVISETDRLSGLIGQLLGSNQLPQWETINIHEPLEHVLILTQTQHPDVKVVRDYDLSLPELTADKNQLIQVFLNLVNNACEAMLEQDFSRCAANYQPTLRVSTRIEYQYTIGSAYHRQVLKVCVHDNGAGIDPDIIDRIFFPLVTGRANGTGLGLALVQEMVHRHCGAIEVESALNNTAFCIYLPFSQTDSG